MEPLNSPAVAIDGEMIRKIREEKHLTQFYVSKVVAVTVDTVSRWENNRYPTIMRGNAVKLAAALEVDLDTILKQESVEESSEMILPEQSTNRKKQFYLLMASIVLLILLYLVLQSIFQPPPVLRARRILPPYAAPGSRILIQTELALDKSLKGLILKEKIPVGWHLLESSPEVSHLDMTTGIARWIFKKPPLKTRVFYLLEVPVDLSTHAEISIHGEVIANPEGQRSIVPVQAVGSMQIRPLHWADTNGNQIIDDLEILEVSDLTESASFLNLEWDLIETIWEAGAYRWEPEKKKFIPIQAFQE